MADTQKVGLAAARMMEKIEEDYPEGTRVNEATMVVSLIVPDLEQFEDESVEIEEGSPYKEGEAEVVDFYSTTPLRSIQVGMIEIVKLQTVNNFTMIDLDDDEDDEQ